MMVGEGGTPSGQQLMILGAVLITGFMVLRINRRRMAGGSSKQYRREIDSATSESAAVKGDMEKLLIELEDFSRKVSAQVDTRFAKLEASIVDADKRIAALRILLDAARAAGASLGLPDELPRPTPATGAPAAERKRAPESPDALSREERIYQLSDQGHSARQIAQRLEEPVGEVELILNLRAATGGSGWPSAETRQLDA